MFAEVLTLAMLGYILNKQAVPTDREPRSGLALRLHPAAEL